MARFRSTVFVLDYAHFESVMSLQSYCQSDFASFVLDLTMTGLLLLLRSVACIESTFLIFGLSCLDLTLLVLDSSLIDLLMSLQSCQHLDFPFSIFSTAESGSLLLMLDLVNLGLFLPLQSPAHLGSTFSIYRNVNFVIPCHWPLTAHALIPAFCHVATSGWASSCWRLES